MQCQQQTDSLRRQMQHSPLLLSLAKAPIAALATAIVLACGDTNTGEIHVVIDTTQVSATLVVVAVPFDPASLHATAAGGAAADSMSLLRALGDSLRAAQQTFERERISINLEVVELRGRDRTSREYATAHTELSRRIAAAESLRAERDALRAQRQTLADELGLTPSELSVSPHIPWARVDSAARAARRGAITATPNADTLTMRLPAGTWWVTAGRVGDYLGSGATRVEVRRAARDTVRLGGSG